VRQDGKRQFGRPGVAPDLVSGLDVVLEVDRGGLGFDEELAGAADAEAVVGGLDVLADADGVLVDDLLVGLSPALRVVHVPTEGFEERVDILPAQLGLAVAALEVVLAVLLERLDQSCHFRR